MSAEDLLFNISCLDDSKKCEVGDTIYYIADFISDPETDGGTIWKIKFDGSQNAPLSVGGQQNEAYTFHSFRSRSSHLLRRCSRFCFSDSKTFTARSVNSGSHISSVFCTSAHGQREA